MIARICALLLLLSVLNACNTIAGAGKDIEHGGRAIEGAADKAKR